MLWIATIMARWGRWLLEVILHIGAHRTGTTSFQRALAQNRHNLTQNGVTVWGPRTTRAGRFSGLLGPRRADTEAQVQRTAGVVSVEMQRLVARGQKTLLISEENLMGSMRANLRQTQLYPDLAERMLRVAGVLAKNCRKVGLCIRPYEDYWSSSMAYAIKAGHQVLTEDQLDQLVTQPRSWRKVVSDVANAFPKAEILVWEFRRFIGRPNAQYRLLAGTRGRLLPMTDQFNASPDTPLLREILALRGDRAGVKAVGRSDARYMPFGPHHLEAFNAQYEQDLQWLRSGSPADFEFIDQIRSTETTKIQRAGGAFS